MGQFFPIKLIDTKLQSIIMRGPHLHLGFTIYQLIIVMKDKSVLKINIYY